MRDGQKISLAKRLRQRETPFEQELWQELRNRRAFRLKFRRQHPVGRFVADFACLDARLLIEIDGYWHGLRKADDDARDRELKAAGFDVVRYDIEKHPMNARTLAEMIAHEARVRIER